MRSILTWHTPVFPATRSSAWPVVVVAATKTVRRRRRRRRLGCSCSWRFFPVFWWPAPAFCTPSPNRWRGRSSLEAAVECGRFDCENCPGSSSTPSPVRFSTEQRRKKLSIIYLFFIMFIFTFKSTKIKNQRKKFLVSIIWSLFPVHVLFTRIEQWKIRLIVGITCKLSITHN